MDFDNDEVPDAFKGAFNQHENDQSDAALAGMAKALREYYQSMIFAGFTDIQASQLTLNYQTILLGITLQMGRQRGGHAG